MREHYSTQSKWEDVTSELPTPNGYWKTILDSIWGATYWLIGFLVAIFLSLGILAYLEWQEQKEQQDQPAINSPLTG